jgi:Protein of unknown function (DUF2846)
MRFLFLLLSLTILASCASGSKYKSEQPLRDDLSRLYVYRPWAFSAALGRPDIQVDGKEYTPLTNGGYAVIELSPGTHTLQFLRMGGSTLGKFTFILSGGENYYLRYEDTAATASRHYQLASDFLRGPKDTVEAFSKDKFGRVDAIQWKHVRSVFDPCFYFVREDVALEEIHKTKKIFP